MVFNIGVRRGRLSASALATVALVSVALSGCGRDAEYQYLEVPDGATFAKIPADWRLDAEGWVDFAFVDASQLNSAFVPGDNPIAWRAMFNGESDGELPQGEIQVQSVDVRNRSELMLGPMIAPGPEVEELSRVKVTIGDLVGWRALQQRDRDGTMWVTDHLILTDARRSTVYYVGVQCTEDCYDRHREEIEEVLTTFRVES